MVLFCFFFKQRSSLFAAVWSLMDFSDDHFSHPQNAHAKETAETLELASKSSVSDYVHAYILYELCLTKWLSTSLFISSRLILSGILASNPRL